MALAQVNELYTLEHGQRMNIQANAGTTFEVSLDGGQTFVTDTLPSVPGFNVFDGGKCVIRFPNVGAPAAQFEIGPVR